MSRTAIPTGEMLSTFIKAEALRHENPNAYKGVTSDIISIRQVVDEYPLATFGVIIAMQKMGKTANLLTLFRRYLEQGFVCGFISNELNPYSMSQRMIANQAQIDMNEMNKFSLSVYEEENVMRIIDAHEQNYDGYFGYNLRTPKAILRFIEEMKENSAKRFAQGLPGSRTPKIALFVDYFNLLRTDKPMRSKVEEQEYLSHWLQSLTLPPHDEELTPESMLGVGCERMTVWTASQVPKTEKRGKSATLTANSAKGSTALEDDATIIMVMNKLKDGKADVPNALICSFTNRFGKSGGEAVVFLEGSQARLRDSDEVLQKTALESIF